MMQNGHTGPEEVPGTAIQAPAQRPEPRSPEPSAPAVDLIAWAQGKEKHSLADVLAAIDAYALAEVEELAARTARIVTRRDAVKFLVDWLVSIEELSPELAEELKDEGGDDE
jgi:hypothetical protein